MINIVGIPFAYNGPCATIAGAGKIFNNAFSKYRECISSLLINQGIEQSALQYLSDVFAYIDDKRIRNTIFVCGNHLSVLPLHKYASKNKIYTIIFDAHRDYRIGLQMEEMKELSHANFLNCFEDLSGTIIFGYRDGKENSFRNCRTYRIGQEEDFFREINLLKDERAQFYVDIDLDVIDPKCFPATGCPIENGMSINDLLKTIRYIGLENIAFMSIEEYIPYLGDECCSKVIDDIISYFIEGWNDCE